MSLTNSATIPKMTNKIENTEILWKRVKGLPTGPEMINFIIISLLISVVQQYKAMIYPEEDEDNMTKLIPNEYPFNIDSLKTRSPTLPLHFDRRYLPRDLCEKQLHTLTECLMFYNFRSEQRELMCRLQSSKFESCRRRRDLRIVNGIYKWETNHWQNLDVQNKGMYLMGLNRKLNRLEQDYQRQPSTTVGLKRAENIEGEIKQLRWRLSYLNKLKETSQK